MSLEKLLADLEDESQPLKHAALGELSNLSEPEVDAFKSRWHLLPVGRRRQVVSPLVEIAEDNLELDFNDVFRICLSDSDWSVRNQAISGLWECEDRTLIVPLINLLRTDPSEEVRAAAALGLGRFATLAEEDKLLPRDSDRILTSLLEVIKSANHPIHVQRRAIEAVARFQIDEVHTIIDEAFRSEDSSVRRSAMHAMGQNCDLSWLPFILAELESEDPAMRYEAARAAGLLGEEKAVPYLAHLLNDDDFQVQEAAIHALGLLGTRSAKRVLQGFLKVTDSSLHEIVEEALTQIGSEEDPLAYKHEF